MWVVFLEDNDSQELNYFAGVVACPEDILALLNESEDATLEQISSGVYLLDILTQRIGPLGNSRWVQREYSRSIARLVPLEHFRVHSGIDRPYRNKVQPENFSSDSFQQFRAAAEEMAVWIHATPNVESGLVWPHLSAYPDDDDDDETPF